MCIIVFRRVNDSHDTIRNETLNYHDCRFLKNEYFIISNVGDQKYMDVI